MRLNYTNRRVEVLATYAQDSSTMYPLSSDVTHHLLFLAEI